MYMYVYMYVLYRALVVSINHCSACGGHFHPPCWFLEGGRRCTCTYIVPLPPVPIHTVHVYAYDLHVPYSRKIWQGIKFGGLAVSACDRQIKIRQYFILAYIRMAIPYRTAKFKSANIFTMVI